MITDIATIVLVMPDKQWCLVKQDNIPYQDTPQLDQPFILKDATEMLPLGTATNVQRIEIPVWTSLPQALKQEMWLGKRCAVLFYCAVGMFRGHYPLVL